MSQYIYKRADARQITKFGVDITLYDTDAPSNVVYEEVEVGHMQEWYSDVSTYQWFIIEGKGTFVINDEKLPADQGDLVVVPPKNRMHYFGKMKMVLITTPYYDEKNEHEVRLIDPERGAGMSQKYVPKLEPITKHPLIQQAFEITEMIYLLLPDMPAEEKWESGAKLRQSANSLLFDVAKAVANVAPTGAEYDWSNARKEAAALLTMYRFAGKQRFVPKDTDVTLAIDKLIKQIDKEIMDTYERTEAYNRIELSVWQDKYDMWQKLNKEIAK